MILLNRVILGGQASGTGQALVPAQIVYLGVQILQSQLKPINWLIPGSNLIPVQPEPAKSRLVTLRARNSSRLNCRWLSR